MQPLRDTGEVTGYYGDGINDANALRLADIGISVNSATGVARAAADIALTKADLGAPLPIVDEGEAPLPTRRNTYRSRQRPVSAT